MGKKPQDLTGRPFGRWTAIRQDGCDSHGNAYWVCRCECGNERRVLACNLLKSTSQSCGCLKLEKTIARSTKHRLLQTNPRLYYSVYGHFEKMQEGGCYSDWTVDPRYTRDAEGVAQFCLDRIAIDPEGCKAYEENLSLVLDKDCDSDKIFRPETICFVTPKENISRRKNTVMLGSTPLAVICREEGYETTRKGRLTLEYDKIKQMWQNYQKIHPLLWNARKQSLEKEERLLEATKLEVRRAELMIAGLKKLIASKSDTLDTRAS